MTYWTTRHLARTYGSAGGHPMCICGRQVVGRQMRRNGITTLRRQSDGQAVIRYSHGRILDAARYERWKARRAAEAPMAR